MHDYYFKKKKPLEKTMDRYLRQIAPELEAAARVPYPKLREKIWLYYETELLERFPYIGGDSASGTGNLTGAYCFVAMGEVLRDYGVPVEESGRLMALAYRRTAQKLPGLVKPLMRLLVRHPALLQRFFQKKDRQNAANAAKHPGSFETRTLVPPEEGCAFSYRYLACPLSDFAKQYGYEEYMPYLCNLDYVLFEELGVPLYRSHTCFADGDYCDFNIRAGAEVLQSWPPVFAQGKGYR